MNEWFRMDGSTWHTPANWLTGAVPNSNADTARLWTALLSNGTVDLAATSATVKSLSFRNSAGAYTVAGSGGGRLTLESNSGNASIVYESGNAQDHGISAGLTLGSNVDFTLGEGRTLILTGQQNWGGRSVNLNSGSLLYRSAAAASNTAGATLNIAAPASVSLGGSTNTSDGTDHVNVVNHGQLSISGGETGNAQAVAGVTGSGSTTVGGFADIVIGGGILTADHIRQGSLSIGKESAVAMRAGGGTSVFGALTLYDALEPINARLDINNNAAILNYTGESPVGAIRQKLLIGRGGAGFGATWTGKGITSSAAAAADAESRSIGFAENATMPLGPYTTFRGQPVDDTSILMAFTRTADANLDGVVNDDDVTIVGATYAPGVAGATWARGDFDYNGFVDDDDVTLLGVFYDPSAAPLIAPPAEPGANGVAAVPEPGTVALLITGLLGILLAVVPSKARQG
jgi:hypothetical protein